MMQIKWFKRIGQYLPGDTLLKDDYGFYKLSHSTYTPVDILAFSLYTYVYRRIIDGSATQEWCVLMTDGSMMEIEAAKNLDRILNTC